MAIFNYFKGMIALTILACIGYLNYFAFTATVEVHGDLGGVYLWTLLVTNSLFAVLVVGLFLSRRSLKKENKRLKSKLESQGD